MNDDAAPRFIVEYVAHPQPVYYIKDRRDVPNGFAPVVIAIVPRQVYARLIADALNAHITRREK